MEIIQATWWTRHIDLSCSVSLEKHEGFVDEHLFYYKAEYLTDVWYAVDKAVGASVYQGKTLEDVIINGRKALKSKRYLDIKNSSKYEELKSEYQSLLRKKDVM